MHTSPKTFGALALASLMAVAAVGCKEPEIKQGGRAGRTVKASIADFDPEAAVTLDLDKYGSARPDDYEVQVAFNQSFAGIDACVLSVKERKGMSADTQIPGDLDIAVQLEPKTGKAAAVNATLPGKYDKDSNLKDCVRDAVAQVAFPKYDGPPVTAVFYTQFDAGSMEE
jgi:hypothetical protein